MAELHGWNVSAASNNSAAPNGWATGTMVPSEVEPTGREMMAVMARYDKDNDGSLTTGGTSTAFTVTLNSQHSAWFTGLRFRAKMNATSGATPTINPTGSTALGAKSIYTPSGAAVATGALLSGGVYDFVYDGTNVQVLNSKGGDVSGPASATDNAVARFDSTTGKLLQDSVLTVGDTGALAISGAGTGIDLTKADDSANGVFVLLYQNSASPAANDLMGLVRWSGNSSLGTKRTYGQFLLSASDVTDASEDGLWTIQTMVAGTLANRVLCGAGWYMAGQSDPGAGNMGAAAYYIGGRLVYPAGCWGTVTYSAGTPTLNASSNITSITDTATGRLTVTIATDFTSANYAGSATAVQSAAGGKAVSTLVSKAAGSFEITSITSDSASPTDPAGIDFECFGNI